jgi:alpha-glucosidase
MRAGFSGVQRHCQLLWAGDQSVDFTRHDGIGTVITGALSAGTRRCSRSKTVSPMVRT